MEAQSVVWGLDIGHTSLKAVKLQRAGDGVTVLGYAIEPIAVGDNIDRDESVVQALQNMVTREGMRGAPVVASLSGRQIFSRTIEVPVLNPKRIHQMVELEARQQIPGNFDDVRWSYHMSPSADGSSNDVALFAARKELVDDLTDKCRRAGLELIGISVTSLAVYNFIAFDQEFEDDESVVVLDVGAESTALVVYQGESLWMRTLGTAGNDITRAFMKKFRVSYEEAENLKCQVADSRQSDRILKVIEPSLAELVSDVQRSLGFYKGQNKDANFQAVVVSGNTFRLPGLAQFMADRLGYGIIELVDLEHIKVAGGLDRDHFLDDLQSLGVAMGLGIQGLGLANANVNLLPSSELLQSMLRQKRWAAVVALVALFVTWIACYMIDLQRLKTNHQIISRIDKRIAAADELQSDARQSLEAIKPLATRISQFDTYQAHVGYLHGIEEQVLEVVQDLALDQNFVRGDVDRDPLDGGDPVPQTLYLESLQIPDLPVGGDVLPFDQHLRAKRGEAGTVTLVVVVPAYADSTRVSNELQARLESLKLLDTAYRALYPTRVRDDGVPAAEQRPAYFRNVTQRGSRPEPFSWVFRDPYYRDPETLLLRPRTETIRQQATEVTLVCELAALDTGAAGG